MLREGKRLERTLPAEARIEQGFGEILAKEPLINKKTAGLECPAEMVV